MIPSWIMIITVNSRSLLNEWRNRDKKGFIDFKRCFTKPTGWGYSTKFYTGRLRPEVQPLTFCIPFFREKVTLSYSVPSLDNWYSFHIPSLELSIPFNCCKFTVFKIWISHKTRNFLDFFTAIKCICWPVCFGPFYHRNDRFTTLFIYFS